jgi:hypothetical protein
VGGALWPRLPRTVSARSFQLRSTASLPNLSSRCRDRGGHDQAIFLKYFMGFEPLRRRTTKNGHGSAPYATTGAPSGAGWPCLSQEVPTRSLHLFPSASLPNLTSGSHDRGGHHQAIPLMKFDICRFANGER